MSFHRLDNFQNDPELSGDAWGTYIQQPYLKSDDEIVDEDIFEVLF